MKKLYSVKAFSKGHLLFERLKHGIPAHLIGFVKNVLKDLIREEIVIYYGKTKYGDAFQLNIKKSLSLPLKCVVCLDFRMLRKIVYFSDIKKLKEIEEMIKT